jgi:hypothetical protein
MSAADVRSMSVERYAEVLAHLLYFPAERRAEVLARLGVEEGVWDAERAGWQAAIQRDVKRGELSQTVAFGGRFAATKKDLEQRRPDLPSIGEIVEKAEAPPCPPPAEAPPPPEAAAPPEPPAPAPPPPPAWSPPAEVLQPTYPSPENVGAAASGTLDLRAVLAAGPALPFARTKAPPSTALENAVAHAEEAQGPPPVHQAAGGTLDLRAVLAAGPPLPFSGRNEGASPSKPPPVEVPKPSLAEAVGETSDLRAVLAAGPLLPFVKAGAAAPRAAEEAAIQPTPASSSSPELTIQQYASLCVELGLRREAFTETLARYHLSPASKAALDTTWQRRFAADPSARPAFDKACAEYQAWLLQQQQRR